VSKMWTGAKVLIMGGAVATGALAAVASGLFGSGDWPGGWPPGQPPGLLAEEAGGSGGIDYNCDLPGTGCPWLEHLPASEWETGESDEPVTSLDAAHLQGFFAATTPYDESPYLMWLPVAIGPDGPSMSDVYRTVCAVHPDLGGSGLRQVPADELETLFTAFEPEGEADDEGADRWLTDDVTRSADEAHLGFEPIRLYYLPVLPMWVRQDLTSGSCGTTASGSEGESAHEAEDEEASVTWQRWRLELTGDELVDLNPLPWGAPGSRQGVGFHFRVVTEFAVEKQDDTWVFRSGYITDLEVATSVQYEPEGDWVVSGSQCSGCDDYSRVVFGHFTGDHLVLEWEDFAPTVVVQACHAGRDCTAEGVPAEAGIHFHTAQLFHGPAWIRLPLESKELSTKTGQWSVGNALTRYAIWGTLTLLDQH
jgi:hypothetical protein